MDTAPAHKAKEDGDGDDEETQGQPTSKGRRRNVERHLAAERERRKHVKGKLQVESRITLGPHTVVTIGFGRNWITCSQNPHPVREH